MTLRAERNFATSSTGVKEVLILGLGNDLLSDDAVGLNVVREIKRHLYPGEPIQVIETSEMGLSLLDFIVGHETALLVDAVQTNTAPPGFLHEWQDPEHLRVLPNGSPHFLGIGELMALGRELGLAVPGLVRIFGIEVEDPFTVAIGMTECLRSAIGSIAQYVLEMARQSAKSGTLEPGREALHPVSLLKNSLTG